MRRKLINLVLSSAFAIAPATVYAQQIDWDKVDVAFGRKAAAAAGDVHRYGFPRTDLTLTVDDVTIRPVFALGGWIAMKPAHDGVRTESTWGESWNRGRDAHY